MNRPRFVPMALLCAGVALLAGVAAGLGVFARGDGTYVTVTSARGVTYEMASSGVYAYNSQQVVAEGVGWDAFTLFVAVPALLVAALFVARGSFRGRLFALGLLAYFFYQYLEYSVGWAFGPLFVLFIVIYAASLAGIVWLGLSIARDGVDNRFTNRFPGRAFALPVVTLAVLLSLLWFQRVALGLGGDMAAAALYGETTMVVQALDLGLVVPVSLLVAVMAWRGSPVGRVLAAVYAVAAVAMASAIFAMVVSAGLVAGELEFPPLIIFGAFVVITGLLGVRIYRSATPDGRSPGGRPRMAAAAAARP